MSNSATPKLREFAGRLLGYEAAEDKPADAKGPVAFRVCEKLRGSLGNLLGAGGFRSLLVRALALAGAEVPWLGALNIKPDGSLQGLGELETKLDSVAVAEGEVVLVAQLLGLLVTFIGPTLTLQLLQDVWPKLDDLIWNRRMP